MFQCVRNIRVCQWLEVLCISISFMMLSPTVQAQTNGYAFLSTFAEKAVKRGGKGMVQHLNALPARKALPDASTLRKRFGVPEGMLKDPLRRSVVQRAAHMMEVEPAIKNVMRSTHRADDLVIQAARYGDDYVRLLPVASRMKALDNNTLAALRRKLPANVPTSAFDMVQRGVNTDAVIDTLKRTGKRGWQVIRPVLDWAKRHPKTTVAALALSWCAVDPEGFEEAVRSSGKTVEGFLDTLVTTGGETTRHVVEHASDELATTTSSLLDQTIRVMTAGWPFLLVLLAVVFRPMRMILLFPIHWVAIRLEKRLEFEQRRSPNEEKSPRRRKAGRGATRQSVKQDGRVL